MALAIEFSSFIGRVERIDPFLDGVLNRWSSRRINYAEDQHLFRAGSMSIRETSQFQEELLAAGVPMDAMTIFHRDTEPPDWLATGVVDGWNAVWLNGTDPGPLVPAISGELMKLQTSSDHTLHILSEAGLVIDPAPPDSTDFKDCVYLSRNDASVELWVPPMPGPSAAWFRLRLDRQRWSTRPADSELLDEIESLLRPLESPGTERS